MANIVNYSKTAHETEVCKKIKCEFQIILKDKKLLRKIQKTLNNRLNVITQGEKNDFMKKS